MRVVAAMVMGMAMTLAGGEAGAQTRVSFPNSAGVEIVGRLFLPAGSGPFPAVIALHGCGGSNNSRGELVRRERDWADRWVAAGH
ncbi:hypothetical protein V8939_18675, partial [Acinetobacter pittii]